MQDKRPDIQTLPDSCPCSDDRDYLSCCRPYHTFQNRPSTPEKLMRSRYSAYALQNYDYIAKTMCGKASENVDMAQVAQNLQGCTWVSLSVLDAPTVLPNQEKGEVEFVAQYAFEDEIFTLHERSLFQKIDGQWFYIDGELKV